MLESLDQCILSSVTGHSLYPEEQNHHGFQQPLFVSLYQNKSLRTMALEVGKDIRVNMSEHICDNVQLTLIN